MRSFAIVPAAGASRRMGRPKLLLPWRGATVIDRVLDIWLASRVSRVAVVVRPGDEALERTCRGRDVDVVVPRQPPPEMKDSVLAGLEHVAARYQPAAEDVWLLAPADMPRFRSETIDLLLQQHDPRTPRILVPRFEQRRGHPILLPWPLAGEVAALAADEGIRALLERHPPRYVSCADADILEDVDTPEDYERLRDS